MNSYQRNPIYGKPVMASNGFVELNIMFSTSGGLVFFNKKRRKGWYKWHQNLGPFVRYEKITEGQVASKHLDDEDEKLAILPPNWENLKLKDEDYIVILDDDRMIDNDY